MNWKVGDAKQRLSELLRRSAEAPQLVFSRDRFVAAVISAETYAAFEEWQRGLGRGTLDRKFDEVRELCAEDGYELEVGERLDRESSITDAD